MVDGTNGTNSDASYSLFEVMARGFHWNVKRSDIGGFFSDIKIIGGIGGIQITKNVAMEATFFVDSLKEMKKALAHDKECIDSRVIHGM